MRILFSYFVFVNSFPKWRCVCGVTSSHSTSCTATCTSRWKESSHSWPTPINEVDLGIPFPVTTVGTSDSVFFAGSSAGRNGKKGEIPREWRVDEVPTAGCTTSLSPS